MSAAIKAMQSRIQHIHFIGIGGVGMGGIAEVLINLGYQISGSDIANNPLISRLRTLGADIAIGHTAEHVAGADVVVVSTAIQTDNIELNAAKSQRIPIIPRAEMLAELMRFSYGIAVSGTHGKTTTTSLVTALLSEGNLDPTFVIGGKLNSVSSNAQLGSGHYMVAEADESDASFLYLQPVVAVVTNIDMDHMATYDMQFDKLTDTFITFLHHIPFYGLAVLCIDDPVIRSLLTRITKPVTTYGFSEDADYRLTDLRQEKGISHFKIINQKTGKQAEICLNLPGEHNVLNAAAAIVVARHLSVPLADCKRGLEKFAGIARRFHLRGELTVAKGQALLIDDYAHHPTEMAATIQATKENWPNRRIVLVFQPHRYTRTRDLFDDFVEVLASVNELLILPVYCAGEVLITGADSKSLCRAIRQRGMSPIHVADKTQLAELLLPILEEDDVVLTMGAGDIAQLSKQLMDNEGTVR